MALSALLALLVGCAPTLRLVDHGPLDGADDAARTVATFRTEPHAWMFLGDFAVTDDAVLVYANLRRPLRAHRLVSYPPGPYDGRNVVLLAARPSAGAEPAALAPVPGFHSRGAPVAAVLTATATGFQLRDGGTLWAVEGGAARVVGEGEPRRLRWGHGRVEALGVRPDAELGTAPGQRQDAVATPSGWAVLLAYDGGGFVEFLAPDGTSRGVVRLPGLGFDSPIDDALAARGDEVVVASTDARTSFWLTRFAADGTPRGDAVHVPSVEADMAASVDPAGVAPRQVLAGEGVVVLVSDTRDGLLLRRIDPVTGAERGREELRLDRDRAVLHAVDGRLWALE